MAIKGGAHGGVMGPGYGKSKRGSKKRMSYGKGKKGGDNSSTGRYTGANRKGTVVSGVA